MILGDYRLEAYTHGFQVRKRKVKGDDAEKPGEVYWSEAKYYPSVEVALQNIYTKMIRDGFDDCEDLQDVIKLVDASREIIRQTAKQASVEDQNQ